MESAKKPVRDAKFLDGYQLAIDIVERCVAKRSHANPQVARVLNMAFQILAEELKAAKPEIQGETNAKKDHSQT